MDGFADLLTDVFTDSSLPSFSDGDLDFENLNFDEKSEEDEAETPTTTDEAQLQEATAEGEVLSDAATTDPLHTTANAHQEQTSDESDGENFMSQTPAGDYTSSGEEHSSSGEDEEMDEGTSEEPGDLSPGCSRENFQDDKKEYTFFSEGEPMVAEGANDPNVRYKVQDGAEGDKEVSYLGRIPEGKDETVTKSAEEREREEDSETEGMKNEQEENVHQLESKTSNEIKPGEDSLAFSSLSLQNLQDLITDVNGEEYVDKMTDFMEDEHQEAGESFADYPSDFSSGEYTRAEENKEENKPGAFPGMEKEACMEGAVMVTPWTLRAQDTEKNEGFLYSRDLEMNADEMTSLDEATGDLDESNSNSDEEEELPRRSSEFSDDVENHKKQENMQLHDYSSVEFSRWSNSGDPNGNHKGDLADFIKSELDALETDNLPSEYLFITDDSDETEDPPSGVNQHPAEHVNHYSVVQRKEAKTTSYNQGSIDDSFFFNSELDTPEVPEVRQPTDEEYEERRNIEQMQKRIEAFKRFYDSDDENRREERQKKVQFCDDPLSQIIHYETDSDRESLSSSSDREEEEDDEEKEEEEGVEEMVGQDEEIGEKHDEEEKKMMDEEEESEVEEMVGQHEEIGEEHEEEEKKMMDEEEEEESEVEEMVGQHEEIGEEHEEEEKKMMDEEEEEESEVEEMVGQHEEIGEEHEEEEKKMMDEEEEEESEVEEMVGQHEEIGEEHEEEENNVMEDDEEKVEEDKDAKAKEEEEIEDNEADEETEEDEEEEEEENEESLSSTETFDDLTDANDSFQISPECDPSNIRLQQKMSEVRDTHAFPKTHKGLSVLKMMIKLGVMTTLGLLMFWMISDQPDFLRDIFPV
ncbi:protein starmaker [Nothobranchius furzeri]|uniref:protein starmaker n=1 Tax=Nothobranchius furzeri TaxID=105023 RepID=UPI00390473E1